MCIEELYKIQVNEGELSTPIPGAEGEQLLQLYKQIEEVLGFAFINKLDTFVVEQLDHAAERAYKQGFIDATELLKS